MISETGGAAIGGRITAGKPNRYGKRMKLNSFRTRPLPEEDSAGYGDSSNTEGRWSPDSDDLFGKQCSMIHARRNKVRIKSAFPYRPPEGENCTISCNSGFLFSPYFAFAKILQSTFSQ